LTQRPYQGIISSMLGKIFELIELETKRQVDGLEMIPSENYASENVLKALGSVLTNKYSEGYPGARYYSGNEVIDQIENYTRDLSNKLFGTAHSNVQPYSGSPANLAVDLALANPGDTILGLALSSGGHLTHGASASFTSKIFKSVQYEVEADGKIDIEKVRKLAQENKPKIIWVGGTAYPYKLDFEPFAQIADSVGAYLVADVSHIVGLIAAGVHPDPAPHVDIMTTTTHKTLRGPRGAIIMVTQKGLNKDTELATKIDKAVFPGLQGGPHDNQIAAIAIALEEASTPEFKEYSEQIIKNAQVLAKELGTNSENHLLLLDLSDYGFGLGYQAHIALEYVGIYVNKNTVPGEKASAFYPSGIRLGTPALTTRGMKEDEMIKIADWIKLVLNEVQGYDLPENQEDRKDFIRNFREVVKNNRNLEAIRLEVRDFASKYPVPGISEG
jgi:glycine hydroxymethyltransferase